MHIIGGGILLQVCDRQPMRGMCPLSAHLRMVLVQDGAGRSSGH